MGWWRVGGLNSFKAHWVWSVLKMGQGEGEEEREGERERGELRFVPISSCLSPLSRFSLAKGWEEQLDSRFILTQNKKGSNEKY